MPFITSEKPYKGTCSSFRTRLVVWVLSLQGQCLYILMVWCLSYFWADTTDIVDEAITFFRANVFFKNFDIKSSSDKLLIYLTLYINIALKRLEGCRTLAEGTKAIINLGLETVPVPGESGFPFPGLFTAAQSKKEAGRLFNELSNPLFSMWINHQHMTSVDFEFTILLPFCLLRF